MKKMIALIVALVLGLVAFSSCALKEEVKEAAEELKAEFPGLVFRKITFCSGILMLSR